MDKEFSPWKPGDAYNNVRDLLPASEDNYQYREWNERRHKWFYYDVQGKNYGMFGDLAALVQPNLICYITLGEETGTGFVFFLVFLLWIFAAYRLWIVWSSKLNFEKV